MDGLNPITRREVFLAAASGEQIETPEPITREEMYLKKIAEGGGGSDLPDTPAEDGTYALQNTVSSGTGTLSWASGGSSGGVLVVHASDAELPVLDKTWTEIKDACDSGSIVITVTADNDITYLASVPAQYGEDTFVVSFMISGTTDTNMYIASSANGYPAVQS